MAEKTIHVVYDGKTEDFEFETVFPTERLSSIGVVEGSEPTATQIKTALSQHYDVGRDEFKDHFVEINPNGNITVRPNASFGK